MGGRLDYQVKIRGFRIELREIDGRHLPQDITLVPELEDFTLLDR